MEDVATDQITAFTPKTGESIRRILILGSISLFFIYSAWSQPDHPLFFRVGAIGLAFVLTSICVFEAIRAIRGKRPVLTLTPDGFINTSIAPELVPWSAVEDMKIVSASFHGRERPVSIEIKIKDSVWNGLTLSRSARLIRYQSDTLWISDIGKVPDVFHAMRSYAHAHGGKVD